MKQKNFNKSTERPMKKLTYLILLALFAASILGGGCSKSDSQSNPLAGMSKAAPSEIQTPYDPATGGSISSGNMNLSLPPGALGLPTTISAKTLAELPEISDPNLKSAGIAYEFGPDGSEFDPAHKPTLTFKYDPTYLSNQGISEDNLVITFYHPVRKEYVTEGGVVDKINKTISVPVEHFTVYLAAAVTPVSGAITVGAPTAVPATPLIASSLYVRSQITVTNGVVATAILRHGNYNDLSFNCSTATPAGSAIDTPMAVDQTLPAVPNRFSAVIPASLINVGTGRRYCIRAVSTWNQIAFSAPVNAQATQELCSLQMNPTAPAPFVISSGFGTQFTLSGTRRNIGCAAGAVVAVANVIPETFGLNSPLSENGAMGTVAGVGQSSIQFNATGPTLFSTGVVSAQVGVFTPGINVKVTGGLLASLQILDENQAPIPNNTLNLSPNALYDFDVRGKDVYGNTVLVNPTWTKTGAIGTIQAVPTEILNTVGVGDGTSGTLTATVGGISHTITVNVQSAATPAGCMSATPGNGKNALTWCPASGANAYNIYFTTDGSDPAKTNPMATKISNVQSPFFHSGIVNSGNYRYVITSVNGGGESAESTPVLLSVPTNSISWNPGSYYDTGGQDFTTGVAADGTGNAYRVGYTDGSQLHLRKFNPGGTTLWTVYLNPIAIGLNGPMGATTTESVHVAVDKQGNSYVVGATTSNLDGIYANAGGRDLFIAKYDTCGNLKWIRHRGTNLDDHATGVAVDKDQNVFIVGLTKGDLDAQGSAGLSDAIVLKYDGAGNWLWTRQIGSSQDDSGTAIALAQDGKSAYITGYTNGSLPGNATNGGLDYFIAKLSATGVTDWIKHRGTTSNDAALSISLDMNDNVYVGGSTYGSLDGIAHTGSGENAFLAKFTSSGGRLWTKLENGNTANAAVVGISSDLIGNIYVVSQFYYAFVTQFPRMHKFDSNGIELLFKPESTFHPGEMSVTSVAVDSENGYFYMGGHFRSSGATFDAWLYKFNLSGQ
jgi:hypothetical protein